MNKVNSRCNTPYEMFGIECGKGWENLYQPILDKIDEINKSGEKTIEVTQVKEKFGRLEIYVNKYTDELTELIEDASEKSIHICEECGKPAESFTEGGWIYTLCNECYNKMVLKNNELINKKG